MTRSPLVALILTFVLTTLCGAAVGADPLLITHGPRDRPRIALTFDLCQTPHKTAGFDRPLVEILKREGAAATFFAGGLWLDSHPAEARELAGIPYFELGNHSLSHPDLRKLDAVAIRREVEETETRIRRLGGDSPRLFRLPFGWHNPRVLREVAANGVRIIQWDVVSGDPDPKVSADGLASAVLRQARNGSIVVMHANGRGWHTAEALPQIIAGLRQRGFELVTVSQLLATQGN